MAVNPQSVGDYWFLAAGALGVVTISYTTSTLLGYVFCIKNPRDHCALRIAATFPNIVSLPILIFPSLCEYTVVKDRFVPSSVEENNRQDTCVALSNTMIFCYFFSYSLLFWTYGHPQLMKSAQLNAKTISNQTVESDLEESSQPPPAAIDEDRTSSAEDPPSAMKQIWQAVKQVFTSVGFLAMIAGFLTGCVPPLQKALFNDGASLRFLGSAVQTLGMASSPMSTLVAAASLVNPHKKSHDEEPAEDDDRPIDNDASAEESPIMSDPQLGPLSLKRRQSLQSFASSFRKSARSAFTISKAPRSREDHLRLLCWFTMSRLIVAPGIVFVIIAVLHRSGALNSVPPMAKLVVLINSCLPGAQIIVVLLKSHEELSDSAQAVASVYLPTYIISCFTIAGWTSLGLWILTD